MAHYLFGEEIDHETVMAILEMSNHKSQYIESDPHIQLDIDSLPIKYKLKLIKQDPSFLKFLNTIETGVLYIVINSLCYEDYRWNISHFELTSDQLFMIYDAADSRMPQQFPNTKTEEMVECLRQILADIDLRYVSENTLSVEQCKRMIIFSTNYIPDIKQYPELHRSILTSITDIKLSPTGLICDTNGIINETTVEFLCHSIELRHLTRQELDGFARRCIHFHGATFREELFNHPKVKKLTKKIKLTSMPN